MSFIDVIIIPQLLPISNYFLLYITYNLLYHINYRQLAPLLAKNWVLTFKYRSAKICIIRNVGENYGTKEF